MDLPTYTNIWRIEKRLYKLYDLRLPMPLPIVWIGVFVGVSVPWWLLLWLVGLPFDAPWHVVYLVPPGVLTWLSTRPVIESKRLTELLQSQLRYLVEPRTWCRMAPKREPDEIAFTVRVWRSRAQVAARGAVRAPLLRRDALPARALLQGAAAVPLAEPVTVDQVRHAGDAPHRAAGDRTAEEQATVADVRPAPRRAAGRTADAAPPLPLPVASPSRSGEPSAPEEREAGAAEPVETGATRPAVVALARQATAPAGDAAGAPAEARTDAAAAALSSRAPDTGPAEVAAPPQAEQAPAPVEPAAPSPARAHAEAAEPAPPPAPSVAEDAPSSPDEDAPSSPDEDAPSSPDEDVPSRKAAFLGAETIRRLRRLAASAESPRGKAGRERTHRTGAADAEPAPHPAPTASDPAPRDAERTVIPLRAASTADDRADLGSTPGPAEERRGETARGDEHTRPGGEPAHRDDARHGDEQAHPGDGERPHRADARPEAERARPAEPAARSDPEPTDPARPEPEDTAAQDAGDDAAEWRRKAWEQHRKGRPPRPYPPPAPRPGAQERQGRPRPLGPQDSPARRPASGTAPHRGPGSAEPREPAPGVTIRAVTDPVTPGGPPGLVAQGRGSAEEPVRLRRVEAVVGRGSSGGWRRLAQVVVGGSRTDTMELDIERARTPLTESRRIMVLGCAGGAGQTTTALMLGHTLARYRDDRVVALDANSGEETLTSKIAAESPETLTSLLKSSETVTGYLGIRAFTSRCESGLEVVGADPDVHAPQRLADLSFLADWRRTLAVLDRHYRITVIDPAAAVAGRLLPYVDQLVLVAPASEDAANAVAMTFEWLDGHGCAELRRRAVLVVNGVSRRSLADVEQAEAVASGRCRAIVRVPWEDALAPGRPGPVDLDHLRMSGRRAYVALAGVLVSTLASIQAQEEVAK
ncbi:conjugal transfer protein [Thermobispora bispora]|uniref:ATPase involved in chromosome partitioning-like protein n=1 Tax=Thermobispora bispora (strain ATCC 19993 / DSM 43833 / CBS 139.67 / JCM 10125 / KCTC 9307 / NBRC 14880 / R51) TaxID=469371 RepID=D6Y7P2_THEBD|nr:conjugal transfer protein [Thermobispora bispora]ADG89753.1 ATPase involved in chromosome partitioning-like protein [Thermobispora bispora DSM 43833]